MTNETLAELISPPTLDCPRVSFAELAADSAVAPWAGLPAVALRENLAGGPPGQATWLRVGWEDGELRLLFSVVDDCVHATMTGRDEPLYEEEVVEVFLDPVGDGASYFEIEVNPRNAVLDLLLRRNRSGWRKDFAWNCEGLRTAVRLTEDGWAAELAIPFRSLVDAAPRAGTSWRVNFFRIDRPADAPRELSAWSPTGRGTFHETSKFGTLKFTG